jgi:hypothetical protein
MDLANPINGPRGPLSNDASQPSRGTRSHLRALVPELIKEIARDAFEDRNLLRLHLSAPVP